MGIQRLGRASIVLAFAIHLAYAFPQADASAMERGWMKSTYDIRNRLESIGFDRPLATALINRCKATARDPRHCVITGAFIAKAESGAGQAVTSCNNVFGMTGGCYESRTAAIDEWVTKYDRWWYRRPNPSHFYSDTPKRKPATYYCMSEHSSNSNGFCPN